MLYTSSSYRTTVPFFALLVGLVCGSCSSDTRAILAPSDAQLSLTAAGPVVANQAVEITVAAAKSDGNPVSDGTEIQLTASAGEFESAKVRDPGRTGRGGRFARPARALSSLSPRRMTARGQAILVASSAVPTRINVSTSADSVPDGGGEVDVTATVFGASNEPVVSAPVEFFATNGSFAPVGPFLTDGDGKATTRLSTNAATQVRARVLTIDSLHHRDRHQGCSGRRPGRACRSA